MNCSVVRFEPFRGLGGIDRLFEQALHGSFGEASDGRAWAPAVDIAETDEAIVLKADLPGIDPKEVGIEVHDGTLTLKGERQFESEENKDNYRRLERVYGSFERRFTLPETVEAEKVEAAYRNGVLEIKLPKRPEARPRQIKVAVQN